MYLGIRWQGDAAIDSKHLAVLKFMKNWLILNFNIKIKLMSEVINIKKKVD